MIRDLPINTIHRRQDVRAIDDATVTGLMDSIRSVGLINPIRVREKNGGWEVIAGSHRLAAVARLGRESIASIVVDDDDLHAELAMIDENICRNDLTPTVRASQTARRKAIYEELHPEAKLGATGIGREKVRQLGETNSAPADRFTAETAKITGKSERAVQRDAERGEKVIDEVKDLITGTHLDTGAYLDKIKDLSPNDQVAAANRDLKAPRPTPKPRARKSAVSAPPGTDVDITAREVSDLLAAWNRASERARAEFLQHVNLTSLVPS